MNFKLLHKLISRFFSQNLLFILTFTICSTLVVFSQEGKYPIKNFTTEDYKAGIQNIDFAQNTSRSLFIANNLGVLSYDGEEWKNYSTRTGKKQRSLAYDQENQRLYVGSQRAFGYFDASWAYHSLIPEEQSFPEFDEVWDVYIHNNEIYFCTFQAIFIYDGESVFYLTHPDGFYRTFQVDNTIITQAKNGKLYKIENKKLQAFDLAVEGNPIAGILQHNEATYIFYNSGEVFITNYLDQQKTPDNLVKTLSGTYVNHVTLLSDSRVAIATQTAGIFLYDLVDGKIDQITTREGLQSNACLRTFQDYYGNLWVGMQNGLAQIHLNVPVRFVNQEIGLQGSGYEAFDTDLCTYFTTSNGIYYLAKGDQQAQPIEGTEGPAYGIKEIAGKIYAGHHNGLFLLSDDKATLIAKTDGLWKIEVLKTNPQYALGGGYDGLYLFTFDQNNNLTLKHKVEGFNESSRFFEEDDDGNIVVSQFYKGLFLLSWNEDYTAVTSEILIPVNQKSKFSNTMIEKIDNDFYLGTDLGVYNFNINSEELLSTDHPLNDIGTGEVYLLKEDAYKNVFYITDQSVGYLEKVSSKNYKNNLSSLYNYRYYFNNDLLHASNYSQDGIMLSANIGFILYQPKNEIVAEQYNAPTIHKVVNVSNNQVIYEKSELHSSANSLAKIEISEKTRAIKIHISSFQFQNMYNQEYQYFLEGFDEDYQEWVKNNEKEYSNLKAGEYTLHVRTKNHLGQEVESTLLSLKVAPPFYKSLPAKIIYLASGLFLLWSLIMVREKRHKQKTSQLKKEKDKAINQLEKEKEVMMLKAKEEKIQTELNHINNLLAASTMNLVVKNDFINTIKDRIEEVQKSKTNKKSALNKIVKDIDSTLKLQEDWEQFEFHFDKVHGEFLNRLREKYTDLSPNEQKLCALLRLNLNTKEIANLLGISVRGVEVARYRLRKKLNLESKENLAKFILEY